MKLPSWLKPESVVCEWCGTQFTTITTAAGQNLYGDPPNTCRIIGGSPYDKGCSACKGSDVAWSKPIELPPR